jgi:hypothetical protein
MASSFTRASNSRGGGRQKIRHIASQNRREDLEINHTATVIDS